MVGWVRKTQIQVSLACIWSVSNAHLLCLKLLTLLPHRNYHQKQAALKLLREKVNCKESEVAFYYLLCSTMGKSL